MVAMDAVVELPRKAASRCSRSFPQRKARRAVRFGANFFEVGKDTGALAASILKGADPAKIPIRNYVPERLLINKLAVKGLKQTWRIPPDVLARADVIIDETGTHEKAKH